MRSAAAIIRAVEDAERAMDQVRRVLPDVLREREVRGWEITSIMVRYTLDVEPVFQLNRLHAVDHRDEAKVAYSRSECVGTFEELATYILGISDLSNRDKGLLIAQLSEV